MLSCRQNHKGPQPEDLIKLELGVLLPISIAVGGATGFMPVLDAFLLVGCISAAFAAIAAPFWLGWRFYQRRRRDNTAAFEVCLPSLDHTEDLSGILISGSFPQPHDFPFEPTPLPLAGDTAAARDDYEFYRERFGAPSSAQSLSREAKTAA